MHCFFLRLTNTLKQPDGLHFITSERNFSTTYGKRASGFCCKSISWSFAAAYPGDQIFMICQSFREVVKRFLSNHKYLVTLR